MSGILYWGLWATPLVGIFCDLDTLEKAGTWLTIPARTWYHAARCFHAEKQIFFYFKTA
jgi:hypothetical protein